MKFGCRILNPPLWQVLATRALILVTPSYKFCHRRRDFPGKSCFFWCQAILVKAEDEAFLGLTLRKPPARSSSTPVIVSATFSVRYRPSVAVRSAFCDNRPCCLGLRCLRMCLVDSWLTGCWQSIRRCLGTWSCGPSCRCTQSCFSFVFIFLLFCFFEGKDVSRSGSEECRSWGSEMMQR